MTTKRTCCVIRQLILVTTVLFVCLIQASEDKCPGYSDTEPQDGPTVYSRVDHFVRPQGSKRFFLLSSNSKPQMRFNFNKKTLEGLYDLAVDEDHDVLYAYFLQKKMTSNYTLYNVNCLKKNDRISNDNSPIGNITCFVPVYYVTPKRGVIKCNKTTDALPECASKSCSLVRFLDEDEYRDPIQIFWVSVLAPESKTNEIKTDWNIHYNERKLNVTSCVIESLCTEKNSTTINRNETSNASTDKDEIGTITGIAVGVVLAVIVAVIAIVGGTVWWKRRRKAKSACKTSIPPLSPASLSDTISTNCYEEPTTPMSESENVNSTTGAAYAALDSNSEVPEETRFGCNFSYENAIGCIVDEGENKVNAIGEASNTEDNSETSDVSVAKGINVEANGGDLLSKRPYVNDTILYEGNDYSRLGENARNIQNPYNALLQPKMDPKSRNPISIPVSTKSPESSETSSYSLAQPVLGAKNKPVEVVDLNSPPIKLAESSRGSGTNQYDWIVHEKDESDWSERNVRDDYDYLSSGEILDNSRISSQTKQADTSTDPYTLAKSPSNPYFELEKENESCVG